MVLAVEVLTPVGVVAAVLLVAALLAGVVEGAPISFPIIFLGLGLVLCLVAAVRRSLSIEAGTNDVIVLPPVLIPAAVVVGLDAWVAAYPLEPISQG